MYAPLQAVRVEDRGKGRVRLHLTGKVPVKDILEAAGPRGGWVDPQGGYVDLYPGRQKRKREIRAEGPLKDILSLGPYRTLPEVNRAGDTLEFSGIEKFRLQRARAIINYVCDFSRGLLCKLTTKAPRKRLRVAKRPPAPEKNR